MKGVLLAGGTGSRLLPLTSVANKHMLHVGRKHMILHPLHKMVLAGVREVMVVTGGGGGPLVSMLGSGRAHGCSLTYRIQDEAGGIAEALGLARDFVGRDDCLVILGDNVFEDDLSGHVAAFSGGATLFLKEVDDPRGFGVAEVAGGKVVSIEEKPAEPRSNLAVTGVYLYDGGVFDVIGTLEPSARGELEITDVNNAYLSAGKLSHVMLDGWWTDAGTHESLLRANLLASGRPF